MRISGPLSENCPRKMSAKMSLILDSLSINESGMDETLIISESQGQGSLDQKTVRDFIYDYR